MSSQTVTSCGRGYTIRLLASVNSPYSCHTEDKVVAPSLSGSNFGILWHGVRQFHGINCYSEVQILQSINIYLLWWVNWFLFSPTDHLLREAIKRYLSTAHRLFIQSHLKPQDPATGILHTTTTTKTTLLSAHAQCQYPSAIPIYETYDYNEKLSYKKSIVLMSQWTAQPG